MDILYLLVPLSVVLILALIALLAWSVYSGQFDDIEGEGERVLDDEPSPAPGDTPPASTRPER
jgi:cbb3-type cytochrome oxidase maturation protein